MKRSASILVLGALLLFAGPALAAEKVKDAKQEQTANNAGKEREAGESRPALSTENVSVEGLKAEQVDGMVRARLEGRFQHALVLRVNQDGTRSVECVDEPARVEKLMAAEKEDASTVAERPEGN